jgi:enoyl-CoA hydratase/carnithine racemase
MGKVNWRREDSVAILTMDDGENRHDPEWVADVLAALDAIEADAQVEAVVWASADPKTWSQGINLPWIMAAFGDRARHEEIRGFLRGLNRVYARALTFPVPVIAALGGHTFGGGAILACCADFRFMRSDRGYFCFPEVDVNIPFMPGMQAIVRKVFPEWKIDDLYLTGRRAGGAELAEVHAVVRTSEGPEALMADATAFAATFHKSRGVFGEIKRRKHRHILDTFEREDEPLIQALKVLG